MAPHLRPTSHFEPKRLALGLIALCISTTTSLAGTTSPSTKGIDYDSFVEAVAKDHPERSIDERSVARAKAAEGRSGLLPDPMFKVGRDQVPLTGRMQREAEMAKDSAEWQIELSQNFPWPGTLSAEERAAKARTGGVKADVKLADEQRRSDAAALFLRLVRTAKLIDVERANLKVVEGIRDFIHEKFKQGIASHHAFLQAHSESGVLKANIAALETDLLNLKRHALLLMNHPSVDHPEAVAFVLDWPDSGGAKTNAQMEQKDLTREHIERSKEADLARQDVEYRRSLPSFMASGALMQEDSGMRMYGAMVGVSIPIYSGSQRQAISSEKALVEDRSNAELSWHDRRRALALAQTESRLGQIETNRKILEDEIIPPVKEHIDAAIVEFSQGKGDLSSIIDGRRTLLGLEASKIQMLEAAALAQLAIERIKTGIIDDSIDVEVPQLSSATSASMNMGGGTSGMGSMPSKRKMPMKDRKSEKTPGGMENQAPSEEMPAAGASGMGM